MFGRYYLQYVPLALHRNEIQLERAALVHFTMLGEKYEVNFI